MQSPSNLGGSSGKDPFIFKDDRLMMPSGAQMVPPENQEPHARQYSLNCPSEQIAFDDLLQKVFDKKAMIWSIEKHWTQEGDCIVAVFYSNIVKKKYVTGSDDVVTVGSISPEVFDKKYKEKEDKLFDEFVLTMDAINNLTPPLDDNSVDNA